MAPRSRNDFETAIICALQLEADAVETLFHKIYENHRYGQIAGDKNTYTLGRIGRHDVVLAWVPKIGKSTSAGVVAGLKPSITGVTLALLVGIRAGVPFGQHDEEVVLGDVILSTQVVEYDSGRRFPDLDTGSPPSYARELYNRFVVNLQQTGCQLVVLGGNHDSVATLNESRELLACLNTRVIAAASDDINQQVLILNKRDGEPGALLCAIPFLRPRDITTSQAGQSGRDKQQSLLSAITQHYQRCWQAAQQQRETLNLPLPIIATGHLTTVGVTKSDAVRDIYIGTLDAFPAQAFPPADYIALGHIHRAQRIGGTEHIRYSGSPIPLSFDELGKEKSVFLVDFVDGKLSKVEPLSIPLFQPMQMIKGSLEEIEQQLAAIPPREDGKVVWLDIEISTQAWLNDLQRRIQELTQELPVEVVLLRRSREQREQAINRHNNETLSELSAQEVFSRRLALVENEEPERQARATELFNLTLAEIDDEAQP